MSLAKQIYECVQASTFHVNDYDQRSAIGMARSWVDNQKSVAWNPDQVEYPHRDQLAKDLIVILEGHEREQQIEALLDARKKVNASFLDPRMAGYRAAREKRGQFLTPGEKKKSRTSEVPKT